MRFVTFHTTDNPCPRFGLRIGQHIILDIERATTARLAREMPPRKAAQIARALTPPAAVCFIAGGDMALAAARDTVAFAERVLANNETLSGADGQPALFRLEDVSLDSPIPETGKFIAAGKNFVDHLAEMTSLSNPSHPVAFAQMNTTFVGPDRIIEIPVETDRLDYEVEVAIIIGKPAYRVPVGSAMSYVFGLTIFNDLSARDVYRAEQGAGVPLLGKNLADCAPLGPHIVTLDEFADPATLALTSRVNGETRQKSTLASMLFDIPNLVSWWSQIGLEPGDVLSSGTPSGVAAGRKPGETPWWIKRGDVVEVEVEGIGVLRTTFA
jgi:acylpyruvate hydrolase